VAGATWAAAHEAVKAEVRLAPHFRELVRCYGGRPSAVAPSRRASRLASLICDETGLEPAVWRGVVYGAAAEAIERRRV
jgi:hypothetical protein